MPQLNESENRNGFGCIRTAEPPVCNRRHCYMHTRPRLALPSCLHGCLHNWHHGITKDLIRLEMFAVHGNKRAECAEQQAEQAAQHLHEQLAAQLATQPAVQLAVQLTT